MGLLHGRRVLLVEDESMVAMLAEDMLLDLGCDVVVAMRLDRAVALARTERFDLAVLDVNLGDARSYPIADVLFENGTPFLFASGYGQKGLDAAYQAVPVMQKPYQAAQMECLLMRLLTCEIPAGRAGGLPRSLCSCQEQPDPSREYRFRADRLD